MYIMHHKWPWWLDTLDLLRIASFSELCWGFWDRCFLACSAWRPRILLACRTTGFGAFVSLRTSMKGRFCQRLAIGLSLAQALGHIAQLVWHEDLLVAAFCQRMYMVDSYTWKFWSLDAVWSRQCRPAHWEGYDDLQWSLKAYWEQSHLPSWFHQGEPSHHTVSFWSKFLQWTRK